MMRLVRAGLATGVVAAAVALAGVSPASSQADPCAASAGDTAKIAGSITAPDADDKVFGEGDGAIPVAGEGFQYKSAHFLDPGDIDRLEVLVTGCGGPTPPEGSFERWTFEGSDNLQRSLHWTTPRLTYNGRYAVKITAIASTGHQRVIVRPFLVDLPPAAPENVRVAAKSGGEGVTVTWAENPEPDLVGYAVQWTASSDTKFREAKSADVLAAGDGAPPTRFEHDPGAGEWRYRVVAVRAGAIQPNVKSSAPSAASTVTVVAPTTTTEAAADGATPTTAPNATTETTAKATTAAAPKSPAGGGVDLSNFSRLLDERRRSVKPPTPTTAPDPGYQETLPFSAADKPAVAAEAPDDGAVETFVQEIISDDGERRKAMAFVAGGLLAFVLAFAMRLVKREAERLDLEPTTPEGDEAPDPDAAYPDVADPDVADPGVPSLEGVHALPLTQSDASEVREPRESRRRRRAARTTAVVEHDAGDDEEVDFMPLPLVEDLPPLDAEPMPAPVLMPAARRATPAHAPNLDVALPPRRARRVLANAVGTEHGRRAPGGVSPRPAVDRGQGDAPVRTRRRRAGGSDRRAPVG